MWKFLRRGSRRGCDCSCRNDARSDDGQNSIPNGIHVNSDITILTDHLYCLLHHADPEDGAPHRPSKSNPHAGSSPGPMPAAMKRTRPFAYQMCPSFGFIRVG